MGIGASGAENKGGARWSTECEDGTTFVGGAEEMAMTMASTDSMCRVKPRPSSTSSTVRENSLSRAVASERAGVSARGPSDSSVDPRFQVPEKKMTTDGGSSLLVSAAPPAPPPRLQRFHGEYHWLESGECTQPVRSIDECSAAAAAIGLPVARAVPSPPQDSWHAPPFCYLDVPAHVLALLPDLQL
jgi:hypothetical protein